MAEKKGFGKKSLLSWVAGKNNKKGFEDKQVSWKNKATVKKAKKTHDKDDVTEKED